MTCSRCGIEFPRTPGPGRPPERCPDCRVAHNREVARDCHNARKAGGDVAALRLQLARVRAKAARLEDAINRLTGGKYA